MAQVKSFLLFYFIVFFICSCSVMPPEKNVSNVLLHNPALDSLVLDSSDFSYPWYMVQHSEGFENTLGEEITKQDTMPLIHHSMAYIKGDFGEYRLPFAKANLENDTLLIKVFKEDAAGYESIGIYINNGKYVLSHDVNHIMPCQSISHYDTTTVMLNRMNLATGDTIKGVFSIKLEEKITCEESQGLENRIVNKIIKGEFVTVVE